MNRRNLVDALPPPPPPPRVTGYSSSLFIDQQSISTNNIECNICMQVLNDPTQCKNGHMFCRYCVVRSLATKSECPTCKVDLSASSISTNLFVKNLIDHMDVHCFTRLTELENANNGTNSMVAILEENDDNEEDETTATSGSKRKASSSSSSSSDSSSGAAAAKISKSDHCTWTGQLHAAKKHSDECEYALSLCSYGCGAVVRRIDMSEHEASICPKRNVKCGHEGCTATMPEPMIAAHEAKCEYKLVDCPFKEIGCKMRMVRKDVKAHHTDAMVAHNNLLLRDNIALRQKINQQTEAIAKHDQMSHARYRAQQKEIQSLQQNQMHRIVFKVDSAELVVSGGIEQLMSDTMTEGLHEAYMSVQHDTDHGSCGVYLNLRHGPYPCHVQGHIELLHWDEKPASACKEEMPHTFMEAEGFGSHEFIRMSRLTVPDSPYVKDGHVTFIMTFQIITLLETEDRE